MFVFASFSMAYRFGWASEPNGVRSPEKTHGLAEVGGLS